MRPSKGQNLEPKVNARNLHSSYVSFSRYDHPDILAGAGACALECMDQVENIDAVVIPIGGGGLIAGCSVAFKTLNPDIEVIVSID